MIELSDGYDEKLRDGTTVRIRAIRGTDEGLEREFIERLSPQSRRYRFLGTIKTPSPGLLWQFTHPEAARGAAFIALTTESDRTREIGVCRYSADLDGVACECAIAVGDEWQGKELATLLMRRLIESARRQGIKRMYSFDANDDQRMRELAQHLGFSRKVDPDDQTLVIHTLDLSATTNLSAADGIGCAAA